MADIPSRLNFKCFLVEKFAVSREKYYVTFVWIRINLLIFVSLIDFVLMQIQFAINAMCMKNAMLPIFLLTHKHRSSARRTLKNSFHRLPFNFHDKILLNRIHNRKDINF